MFTRKKHLKEENALLKNQIAEHLSTIKSYEEENADLQTSLKISQKELEKVEYALKLTQEELKSQINRTHELKEEFTHQNNSDKEYFFSKFKVITDAVANAMYDISIKFPELSSTSIETKETENLKED